MRVKFLFMLLLLFTSDFISAQTNTPADSTKIYRDIESYSKRSSFTNFIYHLIFKPVDTSSNKKKKSKKVYKKLIQKPYSAFEGKIIRNINIVTLDPFGYSVTDTSAQKQYSILKAANKVHVKTQNITIRNLLLIREGDLFDSLLVKESERLIRNSKYVHDVFFYVSTPSKNSDSVDVTIRELDNWSIIPGIHISSTRFTLDLTERNFIGLGHESENHISWNYSIGGNAYDVNYFIPNIRNTYINTTLHYNTDEYGNYYKSISADRPFFSSYAKWAAGINFTQVYRGDSVYLVDPLYVLNKFKINSQDYWAGYSFQIFTGRTEDNRTTNFITTARYLHNHFPIRPGEEHDPSHTFADENLYLGSIGISQRKYVQDKFIFKFGKTEDLPIGKVLNFTGGYQIKNNVGRLYLGVRLSAGNYFSWGYLSSTYEYGTYFHKSKAEQGVISANVIYFTGLWETGEWKFRQFIKPQLTIGVNRIASDSLTLKEGNGLDGFNSISLQGSDRILLTLQTQSYSPWTLIGFKFGPFISFTMGMLGDNETGFSRSRIYSQIGIGVLFKNENLVINTFQFSISFYPLIPGNGKDIFKINSIRTTDFELRDFDISKPSVVLFE